MSRNDLTTKKSKKVRKSSWKYENTEPVELCKGARIDPMVYEISENRYYTLVIKGFIVYLITAGGLGAYLTAFDVEFNQLIFNAVIFVTAIICAALYHSWKSENLGYLVFFAFYAAIMVLFKDYINSGFYAVVNDTIDWASIYFDTEGLQYYNERIANREAAITISMSVIGVMQVPVEESPDIIHETVDLFAPADLFLKTVGLPELQNPERDDPRNHKAGDHSGEKDLLRIVAGCVFVDLFGLVPHLALLLSAQTRKHAQVEEAGPDHVEPERDLKEQYQHALYDLSVKHQSRSHEYDGELCKKIAVYQSAADGDTIFFHRYCPPDGVNA